MSYRSVKLALGETSLERKCRFLFGASLLVLITASFWGYGVQTEKLVYEQYRISGRMLVDQVLYRSHWEYWESEKSKDFVRDLGSKLRKQQYTYSFIVPGSTEADEFELDLLKRFSKPETAAQAASDVPLYEERPPAGRDSYDYYEPVYANASSCVTCHRALRPVDPLAVTTTPQLVEGDLMAIAKVGIPNAAMQKSLAWNRALLISTAIITAFLAMLASYAIVRYVIVKPLRHLRDVSDAISLGNTSLRADIRTGDEFEGLSVAFNRMLHNLVAVQDEIRATNTTLDNKVDELAQANMRLYELNMLKSDFLATMSHELRTPLNSILGFSDVLGGIDTLSDKQKRYVQNIQKSGRVLLEMINDILDLAKIESGNMEVRLSDFAIEHVIDAQCDMARPLAERKNIDLVAKVTPGLTLLRQDQARVQQILNNLLSNAIKFTPEGGRITVGAQRDDAGWLAMQVSDTGVGIAPEDQQAIFEKFRQGRTGVPSADAMTREYSGTGLGLSIVKELCKLLGGEVRLESELGRGSTFTVHLPWTLEAAQRPDSALSATLQEFARPRLELMRDRAPGEAQ